jgi:UDP-N-acetylmuramyl pentapeptide phosphotransferase/UDP-N-acetylglucosamine-1-phosphate transferase
MYNLILIFSSILIIFFLNNFIKKNKFLKNYNGQKHQAFVGKKDIPLTGGIFLFLASILVFYNFNQLFCIFLSLIFLVGLASDTNYLSSPKIRFLLQCLILFIFAIVFKLNIESTRIFFLDFFLNNIIFSFLFVTFCLLIVINGTNFIDGLNGLVLTYYLIITIIIASFDLNFFLQLDDEKLNLLFFFLIIILVFNILDQLYIGDSGAYLLGFIFGVLLIMIYQNNQNISPFFIILLLWYPCFENLFSIIRKFKLKRSPLKPDNKHFHQLLFNFLQKKIKIKQIYLNNLTSFIIILYNLLIFKLATLNIYNTQYQVTLILINIFIYVFIYLRLFNYFFKINKK